MRMRDCASGWRGAALVAITYVYFLIFAQFAFLARLAEMGVAQSALNLVMGAMAAGGILLSLLTSKLVARLKSASLLRLGFLACAVAAALSCAPLVMASAAAVAFLIGAGLGVLTVSLVTHLPQWAGKRYPILMVGIGTGAGYFVCNIPAAFTASPIHQAIFAALLCTLGGAVASNTPSKPDARVETLRVPFPLLLCRFAALVWLDSAAFYIIQHTPLLKAGTWIGSLHLWANGGIHLAAAIVASLLLRSHRTILVLSVSVIALGFACTLLGHPALIVSASIFYPVGVSFYSTALVAYPAFLSGARTLQERARIAGWLYAVAGWVASALGVGMGKNLGYVPPAFVSVAGIVVLLPALFLMLRERKREVLLLAVVMLTALGMERLLPSSMPEAARAPVERGRQIYISEGCIACHSQYVRPGTPDELMWGPLQSMQQVHAQVPPLIGNRRQGPDLAEVGLRRSPLWLKAHLIAPAALSGSSPMPSYAFLFEGGRGDDLVAYLASLNDRSTSQRPQQAAWYPSQEVWQEAGVTDGPELYARHCATCHEGDGAARSRWGEQFRHVPPDLFGSQDQRVRSAPELARAIKFGLPDSDMPGHEYLSDREIVSLTLWLLGHAAQPVPHS